MEPTNEYEAIVHGQKVIVKRYPLVMPKADLRYPLFDFRVKMPATELLMRDGGRINIKKGPNE